MNVRRLLSPDALVLVALLALLAFLSVRIAGQNLLPEDKTNPRRSVASPRPGGWRALYLLLRQNNVRTVRIEREPEAWPNNLRVVVAGQEYLPGGVRTASSGSSSGGTSGQPNRRGRGGNKNNSNPPDPAGENEWTQRQARAALAWLETPDEATGRGRALVVLTGENNALVRALGLGVARRGGGANATLPRLQPLPLVQNVDSVRVPGTTRWERTPAGAVPVFADANPAVLVLRRKTGTVVAISDAAFADNAHLAEADNARFLIDIVQQFGGGGANAARVGFDEYHQGFQEGDGFWQAVGRPGQLVAWQLFALVVLLCWSAGRRFGLPRPMPAPPRVSSEYVSSLASLYRRARAADAALEGVYLPFWRELCRAVGLPYDAPTEEVARRAARTLGGGVVGAGRSPAAQDALESRLTNAMLACERKIEENDVRDRDLVPLARDLEQMRKELGLERSDDEQREQRRAA